MDGYKLEQLLKWTRESGSIDYYSLLPGDRVQISHSGKTEEYEKAKAERLLRRLIRCINKGRE